MEFVANSGNFEKASKYFEEAIKQDPSDWESIRDLALTQLELNNQKGFNQAIEALVDTGAIAENDALWNFGFRDILESVNLELSEDALSNLSRQIMARYGAEKHVNQAGQIKSDSLPSVEHLANNQNFKLHSSATLMHPSFNFQRGLTVEFWAKLGSSFGWLLNYGGEQWGKSMNDGFSFIQMDNGDLRFEIANSQTGEKIALDTAVPDKSGSIFAITWNPSVNSLNVYLNGMPILTPSGSHSFNFENPIPFGGHDKPVTFQDQSY